MMRSDLWWRFHEAMTLEKEDFPLILLDGPDPILIKRVVAVLPDLGYCFDHQRWCYYHSTYRMLSPEMVERAVKTRDASYLEWQIGM